MFSWHMARVVSVARQELESCSMAAVAVKLVILGSPCFESENGTRAITDSTYVGVAHSFGLDRIIQGSQSCSGLEVVDDPFSPPSPNDNTLPSFMLSETRGERRHRGGPEQRERAVTGSTRRRGGVVNVVDEGLNIGQG